MANKKTVSLVMAAVMAIATLFTFTACAPKAPELTGIEITTAPTKVEYILGEKFDPAGMVVSKKFDDESKTALNAEEYTWDLKNELKLSDKKVTISYKTEEKTFTASVNIKVTNDIKSVDVVTEPTKKEYIAGEVFNPAGMTIQATLQNNSKEEVVEVTENLVTYKTTGLVKSDEHFKMEYGGFTFYLEIKVSHGAFLEAEAGQVDGARITGQAPDTSAIEKDYQNAYGNRDDAQGHRGIDKGKNCKTILGAGNDNYNCEKGGPNGCTIEGTRVDVTHYVYDHLEWTETTGGEPAKSGMMQNNHIYFKRAGEKMLYKLTADKAGKVLVTFKMANPNITGAVATETNLNQIFKVTVGNTAVVIPETVKLASVDWSEYKSYNSDADVAVKGQPDKYTGPACTPIFCWQNVTVELTVEKGVNSLTVESLWNGNESIGVRLDSISCNADEDEITISLNSEFKPTVKSAQLKVDGTKVLLGVIADAHAVGFTDDEVKGYFMNTKVANVSNATYYGNVLGGTIDGQPITSNTDTNDPWTQSVLNGGLGYTEAPYAVDLNNNTTKVSYKDDMGGKGNADSVEKITEGKFADCYVIWYDVTIPATNSDNYVGVWTFTNFNYGTDFAASKPDQDIVKTDVDVTAELGGYCYQAYCDSRDNNVTFGWGNLCLVVQKGSFEGEGACNKLMRRWISHWTNDRNDQELVDKRKEPATPAA